MRSDFGRQLIATGDNERAARLSGVRVDRVRILAFVLSGVLAAVAGILLGGFAGVSAQVGQGLEFDAITAAVLGGVVLGGGRGSVVAAMAGALTLEALFTWLNLQGISGALEDTVQGVIIIAAVAFAVLPAAGRADEREPSNTTGGNANDVEEDGGAIRPAGVRAGRSARAARTIRRRRRTNRRARRDRRGAQESQTGEQSEFFVQEDYDRQLAQRVDRARGPGRQAVGAGDRARDGRHGRVQVGQGERLEHLLLERRERQPVAPDRLQDDAAGGQAARARSASSRVVDAEAKDDKQISDIESMTSGNKCDALIVSPNTTATLTPAVEEACKADIPVIVFDRGVETDCPVTFIHPIGGYAFGADAAEFLVENVDAGGKILALRILPGVDVLETRWSGAKGIFDEADLNVVGVEFTDGDAAKTKSIVSDYIQREGELDGVWMDAGATAGGGDRGVRGRGRGRAADHRRGPARLPDQVEGGRPHRRRSDVLQLPVAYGDHRGDEDPQGRGGPEGVGPAAAEDHRGRRSTTTSTRTCRRCTTRCAGARTCPATPVPGSRNRSEARRQHLDLDLAADATRAWPSSRRGCATGGSTSSSSRSSSSATGARSAPPRCWPSTGSAPRCASRWAPGASCAAPIAETVATTQAFLRECLDVAATVGSPAIAGPIYTSVGRTWRVAPDERRRAVRRAAREPRAACATTARERGVKIAVEPLVRYETSLINTVEQALEAIDGLPPEGCGLLVDTYHANIEEKDVAAALPARRGPARPRPRLGQRPRRAGRRPHRLARGARRAARRSATTAAVVIESFTAENETIATAASIWRPLAAVAGRDRRRRPGVPARPVRLNDPRSKPVHLQTVGRCGYGRSWPTMRPSTCVSPA